MNATDTLRAEHQGIERVIAVLEAALRRLEANQDVPAEIFKQVGDFFHGFVDTCHHSEEEIELFPTLERHGIPRQGGPIGVMLYEHEEGRRHVRAMAEAADRHVVGDRSAKSALMEHGRAYALLLQQHIVKENTILFNMADRVLSPADQDRLNEAFERVEREKTGPGAHARYERMIEEMERVASAW